MDLLGPLVDSVIAGANTDALRRGLMDPPAVPGRADEAERLLARRRREPRPRQPATDADMVPKESGSAVLTPPDEAVIIVFRREASTTPRSSVALGTPAATPLSRNLPTAIPDQLAAMIGARLNRSRSNTPARVWKQCRAVLGRPRHRTRPPKRARQRERYGPPRGQSIASAGMRSARAPEGAGPVAGQPSTRPINSSQAIPICCERAAAAVDLARSRYRLMTVCDR